VFFGNAAMVLTSGRVFAESPHYQIHVSTSKKMPVW